MWSGQRRRAARLCRQRDYAVTPRKVSTQRPPAYNEALAAPVVTIRQNAHSHFPSIDPPRNPTQRDASSGPKAGHLMSCTRLGRVSMYARQRCTGPNPRPSQVGVPAHHAPRCGALRFQPISGHCESSKVLASTHVTSWLARLCCAFSQRFVATGSQPRNRRNSDRSVIYRAGRNRNVPAFTPRALFRRVCGGSPPPHPASTAQHIRSDHSLNGSRPDAPAPRLRSPASRLRSPASLLRSLQIPPLAHILIGEPDPTSPGHAQGAFSKSGYRFCRPNAP
jgi:hypothetical protein